jgi:hypothetical protein
VTDENARALGKRRWAGRSLAERSAHGRMMARARWGDSPRARGTTLRKPLTRARKEIPQSWLDSFVAREVERTGCSPQEARKRGIQYWEED